MKKVYISALFLWGAVSGFAQQKEYSGRMHVTPLSLQQKGDSAYVKLKFDISGVNVDSRRSISLVPALVTPTNRLDLAEVMVKGRENYNVYQREMSLMNDRKRAAYDKNAPYAVLPGFKSKHSKTIEYNVAIKYEPWMADAKLDMYEDLCGCGSPARRMGVTMLANQMSLEKVVVIEPYVIVPYLAYLQPATEKVKQREVIGEAFLDFVVNQTAIRPDYMNNPSELRKITDLIAEAKNDKNVTVRAINVIGYASPEGTIAGNQLLSEGRAKALVEYLLPQFSYPRSLYNVKFGGENWPGLKKYVEDSQMPYRQQILDIIESVPEEINYVTKTSRKKALMNLAGGEPYRYMLRTFFPSLRKAICKIDFEVKNFDIIEAREVIKNRPQNLSLNEMFLVANTYEKGSQEFIDLFETAVRIFPNDATANLNAATAALSRGDIVYAKRYLEKIKEAINSPEYHNTVGVIEMLVGNYDKAEESLGKAAQMGSKEAKLNLMEIAQKRESMIQVEKQKQTSKR